MLLFDNQKEGRVIMPIIQIPSICKKCNNVSDQLWPLGGGVCSECLVACFTLEEAIKSTCSCFYNEITQLFKGK